MPSTPSLVVLAAHWLYPARAVWLSPASVSPYVSHQHASAYSAVEPWQCLLPEPCMTKKGPGFVCATQARVGFLCFLSWVVQRLPFSWA